MWRLRTKLRDHWSRATAGRSLERWSPGRYDFVLVAVVIVMIVSSRLFITRLVRVSWFFGILSFSSSSM
ncbi:MAG: hypothetical protein KDB27_32835 [Planctomycetales bacterium]|nr:hypothetical protein [Planctomycetales bacterium]